MKPVITLLLSLLPLAAWAQTDYIPEIHGTIRSKFEWQPTIGKSRFEVRNARISLDGKIVPTLRYKAEIDLSDEGAIKMLDAYVRYQPKDFFRFTMGQMRVPFTIDAHRSPHQQYFANRSFIAKQVGNVRDVGAALLYRPFTPLTLEGGLFNGSGLTNQKNFWTDSFNFSAKLQYMPVKDWNITVSTQKAHFDAATVMMYDAGAYWDNGRWHIEAEYLRKHYLRDAFRPVNAVDAFGAYRIPVKKYLTGVSILGRYDYMSDHSNGTPNGDGNLTVNDPERHRLTGGVTLSMGRGALQGDLRINYEQYFYSPGVKPKISEQNKVTIELVARF